MWGACWAARTRNQCRDVLISANHQGVRAVSSNETRSDKLVTVRVEEVRSSTPGLRNLNRSLERSYVRLAAALAQEAERPAP